jgi:hypothetical protein
LSKVGAPESGRKVPKTSMADVLIALGTDPENAMRLYGKLLTELWQAGDYRLLASAINSGKLNPATQSVLIALVTGKLRRPNHRPPKKGLFEEESQRALRVLDIERDGCNKRESAVQEAADELGCSTRTVQKALSKHESWLRQADHGVLESIRAFKSRT